MNRTARRELVRDILHREQIGSQEELVHALRRRGIHAAQATISRDLRSLGVVRAPAPLGARYLLPEENTVAAAATPAEEGDRRVERAFRDSVTSLLEPSAMLVLKTPVGFANSVAISIDQANDRDVLATIAGDDTILVLFRDAAAKRRCARRWAGWLR